MIHAYSENYLDDAMRNLGEAFDFAHAVGHLELDSFFAMFINSGIADFFHGQCAVINFQIVKRSVDAAVVFVGIADRQFVRVGVEFAGHGLFGFDQSVDQKFAMNRAIRAAFSNGSDEVGAVEFEFPFAPNTELFLFALPVCVPAGRYCVAVEIYGKHIVVAGAEHDDGLLFCRGKRIESHFADESERIHEVFVRLRRVEVDDRGIPCKCKSLFGGLDAL